MKIRVQLRDLPGQDIDSDGELSIELDGGALFVSERKPNVYTHRTLAFFAPGVWLSAHVVDDED